MFATWPEPHSNISTMVLTNSIEHNNEMSVKLASYTQLLDATPAANLPTLGEPVQPRYSYTVEYQHPLLLKQIVPISYIK